MKERKGTMAKHVNKKSKTNKSRLRTQAATFRGRQPSFQVRDVFKRKLSCINEETLSAMKERRRFATDDKAPGYRTMDELEAALEK